MKLKMGSIISVITDVNELEEIKSRENLIGTKFLIINFISLIKDIGESSFFNVVDVDLRDNTLLIRYGGDESYDSIRRNTVWIPSYIAISNSQRLPKLKTVTNDRLFIEWLDIAKDMYNEDIQ